MSKSKKTTKTTPAMSEEELFDSLYNSILDSLEDVKKLTKAEKQNVMYDAIASYITERYPKFDELLKDERDSAHSKEKTDNYFTNPDYALVAFCTADTLDKKRSFREIEMWPKSHLNYDVAMRCDNFTEFAKTFTVFNAYHCDDADVFDVHSPNFELVTRESKKNKSEYVDVSLQKAFELLCAYAENICK